MKTFCLIPELAEKLASAARKGEITIAQLYDLNSKQRRELFSKYIDPKTAIKVNSEFEKAVLSEQTEVLNKWVENTFKGRKEKEKSRYKDLINKVDSLNELGALTPENEDSFLDDLVATELGINITSEEAANIAEKSKLLQSLNKDETEFGTPTLEYFKARRDLENYLDSLSPSSKVKVASSIIARGNMLLSIKSPLLNIESNTVMGFLQAAERRLTNKEFNGTNGDYGVRYMKYVMDVFNKTGFDLTRMITLQTKRKSLGEDIITTQGEGKTRKIGRFYEDIVFKKLMSTPDVAFASAHFSDSANLLSTKIAKNKKLKGDDLKAEALRIFKDATRLEPQTPEGQYVREQAISDAEYATYTNKSVYADIGLNIRKIFNIPSGDFRVGDNIMPFVKTPANVIGAGLEASGIPVSVNTTIKLFNFIKDIKNGVSISEARAENFKGLTRQWVRAGLGFTAAYLISAAFQPEDFIGEFPVSEKERELLKLKNATTNSIKIGNKWISLDYFGPIGTPLVGMLYAKKYGKSLGEAMYFYGRGVFRQSTKIPGFTEMANLVEGVNENIDANMKLDEHVNSVINYGIDFLRGRLIPGFTYDIAKATDPIDRKTDTNKNPLEKTIASLPYFRTTLPEKTNIFGDTIKTEGWGTIFTGSRVKTANDEYIVKELGRLDTTGNLPSITDVEKRDTAKEFKEQVGDETYNKAIKEFKVEFKSRIYNLMATESYDDLEDADKKTKIDNIKNKLFDNTIRKYGYKKVKK